MVERRKNIRRVKRLFEHLRKGLTAGEIIRMEEEGHRAQERGEQSEACVVEALKLLPEVLAIQRSGRDPEQDRRGIDLVAQLVTEGTDFTINAIKIQVKSSQAEVLRFRDNIRRGKRVTDEQVNTWLRQNRFIVLNGQQMPEKIQADFLNQLTEINRFHRQKRGN